MEPIIDPETLQLLEQRMRNTNPPTKPRHSETKPSTTTETPEDNRMLVETPKPQYNTAIVSQAPQQLHQGSNEFLSASEKENSKAFIGLEPNNGFEDLQEKEALEEFKIDTTDISYQSGNQRGSNSIKKRKHDKLEKLETQPDKVNEPFQMKTKKTKLTPHIPLEGYLRTRETLVRADTSGSGEEHEQIKENAIMASKTIYDFFGKKGLGTGTTTERASVRATGKARAKPQTIEKKMEILEVKESIEDNRKELYGKIKDLEDKLENGKKEREKDNIKANNEIKNIEEKFKSYKATVHKVMARNVLDIENFKRNERKSYLDRQRQRLGEYVSQR